jgi:uncharacterized membrane protein YfcA
MSGTMDHLIAAGLAVFAGSIVEGILGFGCSLVWMSFFPLFTTVPDAVGVLQPMHIALNVFLLSGMWRKCTPKELKPLAMTAPFGIVFGLWIVTSWSSNAIDCVLGIFLIVYTFLKKNDDEGHKDHNDEESVAGRANHLKRKESDLELSPLDEIDFGEEKKDDSNNIQKIPHPTLELSPLTHRHSMSIMEAASVPNLNKNSKQSKANPKLHTPTTSKTNNDHSSASKMLRNPTAICAGLVGGALMGAFGTGGPAFLIYAKEAGWQKRPELFRANLQLLFVVINVPCCLSQFAEGIITYERCKASCCLLPALIAGGHVGGILAKKVPKDKFQILVVNGLRIMGLMFLIEATR